MSLKKICFACRIKAQCIRQTSERAKERIGTSPHTWGIPNASTRTTCDEEHPHVRGEDMLNAASKEQGHPHIRGEDSPQIQPLSCLSGTSPHTWGLHYWTDNGSFARGDIPTFVGKTSRGHVRASAKRDIPTCVGKTLKMLSKIKHLTFSKITNLLTFNHF